MKALRKHFQHKSSHISLLLLVSLFLFMQSYLQQHQVEHTHNLVQDHAHDHHIHHDSDETVGGCVFCLAAYQNHQLILPIVHQLSPGLLHACIIAWVSVVHIPSPIFFLPQSRAPPQY